MQRVFLKAVSKRNIENITVDVTYALSRQVVRFVAKNWIAWWKLSNPFYYGTFLSDAE